MIFSPYRRLLKYGKPFRAKFALGIFFNIVASLFNVIVLVALLPAMQVLLGEHSTLPTKPVASSGLFGGALSSFRDYFLTGTPLDALAKICGFMFLAYILKNIFQYLGHYFMTLVEGGMSKALRDAVFAKLASLSIDYFYDRRTGQLLARVTDDVGVTNGALLTSLITLVREPLQMLAFIITLFSLNSNLAFIGFGIAFLSILLINLLGKSLKRYAARVQENIGGFMSIAQETITGIKVVKSFGMEDYEVGRFKEETKRHFKFSRRLMRIRQTINPLNETMAITGFIAILWFGGQEVFAGRLNGSDLFFFLIALVQMMQPVRGLSEVIGKLHEGGAAADNVFSVLDAEPSVKSGTIKAPHAHTQPIRFENVSFGYRNSSEHALEHISINVEPQRVLALVGPSGAGKTTFVDLLARFYDPTAGRIMLEGNDIRDYELNSLRKLFGIVTQDTVLFHDTIFNNIAYGDREATHAMVIEAAQAANAHDFIMAMPDGYNTIVGDRGVRMSGGQRQRVAIARALVKNPPILIFDEATSALDTESEKLVQKAIERLLEHRTAIIIAHRLSTIQRADRILVLEGGKLIESGTHTDLLANAGLYQRLYQYQFTANASLYETE
jgi:ATP-binding cassette, subfamily B, bacterial MsbA